MSSLVRFAEFTLDPGRRQLLRDGVDTGLKPKELTLLELLVRRRPKAVSKAEIHGALWPRTFVTESNLTSLVTELRTVLGDDAKAPRFIRTVYGFGYAFCGPVDEDAPPPAAATDAPQILFDGRRYPLSPGENILGRVEGGLIWLESKTASRRHARIVLGPSGATLEDLGSKNGTFLGGRVVVVPTPLRDGDEIEIGGAKLRYLSNPLADSTRTDIRR